MGAEMVVNNGERGEKGDAGQHGQTGDPGATGATGAQGERGRTGAGRFALVGYLILVAANVSAFAAFGHAINEIREERDQRISDTRNTDHIICERSVFNASVNKEQNERLTRLLVEVRKSRMLRPEYPTAFDNEVERNLARAREENRLLDKIALENCRGLPESRPSDLP